LGVKQTLAVLLRAVKFSGRHMLLLLFCPSITITVWVKCSACIGYKDVVTFRRSSKVAMQAPSGRGVTSSAMEGFRRGWWQAAFLCDGLMVTVWQEWKSS
jgi:hypothetical protein